MAIDQRWRAKLDTDRPVDRQSGRVGGGLVLAAVTTGAVVSGLQLLDLGGGTIGAWLIVLVLALGGCGIFLIGASATAPADEAPGRLGAVAAGAGLIVLSTAVVVGLVTPSGHPAQWIAVGLVYVGFGPTVLGLGAVCLAALLRRRHRRMAVALLAGLGLMVASTGAAPFLALPALVVLGAGFADLGLIAARR